MIQSNTSCISVEISTGAGMSGCPLCLTSADGQSLEFCGVYNGAAAISFQALVSKILFRVQGRQINFELKDIPRQPDRVKFEEHILWTKALKKLLQSFSGQDNDAQEILQNLEPRLRDLLRVAEVSGVRVEHNLVICGGKRLDSIIAGLRNINNNLNNVNVTNINLSANFIELNVWGSQPYFIPKTRDANFARFWRDGVEGRRRRFLFFVQDAKQISAKLLKYIPQFLEKAERMKRQALEQATGTGQTVEQAQAQVSRRINGIFLKKIWLKFRVLFGIWMESLNNL